MEPPAELLQRKQGFGGRWVLCMSGLRALAKATVKREKRATCFVTLLRNELIAMLRVLPPTYQPVLQQVRLQGFFSVGNKTRNIAIQLVLQQSRQTSCKFFVARFTLTQVAHVVNITLFLLYRTLEQSEGEYDSVQ